MLLIIIIDILLIIKYNFIINDKREKMKNIYIVLLLLISCNLGAKILISPAESLKNSFGVDTQVVKKNILLNKKQAKKVSKNARVKLDSKIFRVYKALKNNKIIAYGILFSKRVRSKNATVLYIIDRDSTLKSIEIIAFNEPMEYLPSKKWNSQFENMQTQNKPRIGKEIATITGATLSARTITDGVRLAFAFYDEILKDK